MKKVILSILLIVTVIMGREELENPFLGNDNFPMGYSLVSNSMPNFMHIYMKGGGMHKLNLTQKQEEAIEDVFATRPPKVMKAALEIKQLETKLALEVVDGGKSAEATRGYCTKKKRDGYFTDRLSSSISKSLNKRTV